MKWNEIKLASIFTLQMGKTPSRANEAFWDKGKHDWISIADLSSFDKYTGSTKETISAEAVATTGIKLVPAGTVIMSFKLSIGKTAITSCDVYTNEAIMAFLDKKAYSIDNCFIYHLFSGLNWEIGKNRAAKGITLNKESLGETKIPLPPLAEQHRIAAILDKADAICRKRQEALKLADAFVKSVFLDMFGDPVLNPKGWERCTIRNIVIDVSYGTSKPAVEDGKFIYLRMNNITSAGHLDLSNLKYISVTEREFEKYSVHKGDVLFNRTNSKELVGKTCVFTEDKPMIIAGYIIRVRTKTSCLPEYLSAVLNSAYGKSTLLGMCKQIVGQANINAQELQNIQILLPPLPLQNRFAEIVQRVEAHKQRLKTHLAEAEQMKKALQQEFFG